MKTSSRMKTRTCKYKTDTVLRRRLVRTRHTTGYVFETLQKFTTVLRDDN
jgi:hypothetical protein